MIRKQFKSTLFFLKIDQRYESKGYLELKIEKLFIELILII